MVEELMSDYGGRLFIAVFGVGLGLLCLVGVLLILRRRTGPAPFLRGGKNRQPRLQVLDAAAVDARRRIVLVRRDNVEHLVMIGGPTDIVIESGIQSASQISALQPLATEPDVLSLQAPPTEPRLQAPARQQQLAAPQKEREASPAMPAETTRREPRRPVVPDRAPVAAETPIEPPLRTPVAAPPATATRTEPPAAIAEAAAPAAAMVAAMRPPETDVPAIAPAPKLTEVAPDSDIGAAADALDAARRRVFQPALDRTPTPALAVPATATLAPEPDSRDEAAAPEPTARSLGSDFDRILEEEMANNLAIEQAATAPSVAAASTPSMPRRDPASPRVTGATPEPSLQNEIARIFGEMSVTRDQR
ncbi:flagellar biosynthetic protein FliO [Rhizobium sp. FY34]|uniref:flagellar biosynthetic protein FliO n=1 Tax=Rhizobium sp. FY34 TaxID=2562309 RepID=UPI0010C08265|nr:flagellar biosynthetic protein FliO [Rhizobium sp. FY34]